MSATFWYCETCNKSMNRTSKSRHLRSQAHLAKCSGEIPKSLPGSTKECEVCCEENTTRGFKKCTQCVHYWCVSCHQKLDKCPFCRVEIQGARPSIQIRDEPSEGEQHYVLYSVRNVWEYMSLMRHLRDVSLDAS
jgi:hypothetical protein